MGKIRIYTDESADVAIVEGLKRKAGGSIEDSRKGIVPISSGDGEF